jgi:hypothetical protein
MNVLSCIKDVNLQQSSVLRSWQPGFGRRHHRFAFHNTVDTKPSVWAHMNLLIYDTAVSYDARVIVFLGFMKKTIKWKDLTPRCQIMHRWMYFLAPWNKTSSELVWHRGANILFTRYKLFQYILMSGTSIEQMIYSMCHIIGSWWMCWIVSKMLTCNNQVYRACGLHGHLSPRCQIQIYQVRIRWEQ